jgi:hypothetical protein
MTQYQVRESAKYEKQLHLYKKGLLFWNYVDCFYREPEETLEQTTDRVINYINKKDKIVLEIKK